MFYKQNISAILLLKSGISAGLNGCLYAYVAIRILAPSQKA